jgi:transposase
MNTLRDQDKPMVVGLDVSKDWVDACLLPGAQTWHVDNERDALDEWAAQLPDGLGLVVLEATGGYEATVAGVLAAHEMPAAIVNPRHARSFARAIGQGAKTDRIDARMLAEMGLRLNPRPSRAPSEQQQALRELTTRRRQYVEMLTMERNRLRMARGPRVRSGLEQHIEWLRRQIENLDGEMLELIRADPVWRERFERMISINGIGNVTACTLISEMSELGRLGRRKLAALAGLAPLANDSGTRRGHRHIQGGRAPVRSALYMAALSARRYNPQVRELADRMSRAGKPPKVILIACAHKLLNILNAVVRSEDGWQPDYHAQNT